MNYQAESQAADAQNALYAQNRQNSLRAFEETQRAANERQSQTLEAAAAEKFDAALETRKAAATQTVAAGEAGLQGLTMDRMFRDIYGHQARFNSRVDQNTDWTMAQLQSEKRGAGYQAVDRINSVQRATKPSFANLGLRIAGAGLDGYSTYKAMNPTVPTTGMSRVPTPTARPVR